MPSIAARLPFLVSLIVACVCTSSRARAQESRRDTLAAVVITASRVPIATVSPIATATVLRGEDLRAQGINRVADALGLVPGAAVVASGPVGSQTSLFLRGGNSNYVKVLVDGVTVNDAGGFFDFSSLSTENIDRIEIVRGPASVLYGSDAVTGVVQVFTTQGTGALTAHAMAGGGSYGTMRSDAGLSGGGARAGFSLGGSHEATNGTLAFNNRFVNDVLSASGRIAPDAVTDLRLAARWTSADYHYPTDYTGAVVDHNAQQTDHRFVLSADAGRRLTEHTELRLSVLANEFLPRSNDPPDSSGGSSSFARGVRTHHEADAHVNVRWASRDVLTLGGTVAVDRESSTSRSHSSYGDDAGGFTASRHNAGVYVQSIGDATDRISYAVGGRVDQNSAFGAFQTLRASLAYVLTPAARVRASLGSAFKAPSFSENFSTGYVTGNPALRPERSRSAELGLDLFLARGALVLRTTGYLQVFRDVIQYTGVAPAPGAPNYYNVAAADANGLEMEAEYRGIERLVLSGSYAWTDTRTTKSGFDTGSGANYVTGERLIRRPPHTFTLSAARRFGAGARLQLVARRVGERDDRDFVPYPAEPVMLPAYTRVDLSAVLPLSSRGPWAIEARADNLFAASYEEIARYPAPGRTVFVGLRVGN